MFLSFHLLLFHMFCFVLYFVFQLPDLYFHIMHIVYLCRIVSSNQVHVSGFPIVWYHLLSYNPNKYWSIMCSYWFVQSSQICCYHQKECFEIFKFKGLTILLFLYSAIIFWLLVQHGDIEINPGLKKKQPKYFSCCHWNVNSLLAHDKISLLTAYYTIHQYDVICVAETFVDSLVSLDDHNLSI